MYRKRIQLQDNHRGHHASMITSLYKKVQQRQVRYVKLSHKTMKILEYEAPQMGISRRLRFRMLFRLC